MTRYCLCPPGAELCAVLCCAVLCCAVLCCAVLCCAVLCCAGTVLCCAVLRCVRLRIVCGNLFPPTHPNPSRPVPPRLLPPPPPSLQHGRFPLHLLARSSLSVSSDVVHTLLLAHPEAVRTPDDAGMLPLHHCVDGPGCDLTTLAALIAAFPAGVMQVLCARVRVVCVLCSCLHTRGFAAVPGCGDLCVCWVPVWEYVGAMPVVSCRAVPVESCLPCS